MFCLLEFTFYICNDFFKIMLTDFGRILIFFIIGVVFTAGGIITAYMIRPNRNYAEKLTSYECGEEPVGSSWVKFNIRFYVIALIFLIFEVETVFLFPWAVAYREIGMFAYVEALIFLVILGVGYVYVWKKGDLEWDKPQGIIPTVSNNMENK